MKFVTLHIPLTVIDEENMTASGTAARVRMFVPDGATVAECVSRFEERMTEELKLVDLGDEE